MSAEPVTELDRRFSGPSAEAAPWDNARRAIEDAELFWISTVRADGRPHVTPLPAVWQDGAIYFLHRSGRAEGRQHRRERQLALVFEVAPTKILAFAKGEFAQTRYLF